MELNIFEEKEAAMEMSEVEKWLGPWGRKAWEISQIFGVYDYTRREKIYKFIDAHLHLCRTETHRKKFIPPGMSLEAIANLPLRVKQSLVGDLHMFESGAYEKESLRERMSTILEKKIDFGEREVWGVVDTTPDIGLRAFDTAMELKEEYRNRISLKVGSYCVFGFKYFRGDKSRLETFTEASARADFLVGLPEKDEKYYEIGFEGHVAILLEMAFHLEKPVHIHVDQENSAFQKDTERVLNVIESMHPRTKEYFLEGEPKIWLIHVVSPSCYSGKEFSQLVEEMKKCNVGVIVCPAAGISMRTLRSEMVPNHNSIARVLEFMREKIPVRIGTDNVNDIFVPSGQGTVLMELFMLAPIIRSFDIQVLVKAAMGISHHEIDIERISRTLYDNEIAHRAHEEKIVNNEEPIFNY